MPSEKPKDPTAGGQVTIVRNSSDDTQTRQIVIYLDRERKGELMFGDSMTFELTPGAHTLRVDNTWNRQDLSFELRAGDHLQFQTKSTASKFSWFLLGFLGAGPMHVFIEPLPSRT